MRLEHTFHVPAGPTPTLATLADLSRVAWCLPGADVAALTGTPPGESAVAGDLHIRTAAGRRAFRGSLRRTDCDLGAGTATIVGTGQEIPGPRTADLTARIRVRREETGAVVSIMTNLVVDGGPVRAARVTTTGTRLLTEFGRCVVAELVSAQQAEQPYDREPQGTGQDARGAAQDADVSGAATVERVRQRSRRDVRLAAPAAAVSALSVAALSVAAVRLLTRRRTRA